MAAQALALFKGLDRDKNGYLDREEMEKIIEMTNFQRKVREISPD